MSNKKDYSIFTSCDDARHYCDKAQYKEASFIEKVKLATHLMFCSACRKYSANNIKLTKLIFKKEVQNFEFEQEQALQFDNNEKDNLEKLFQEQIKQAQGQ